jgi:hypothetical protein
MPSESHIELTDRWYTTRSVHDTAASQLLIDEALWYEEGDIMADPTMTLLRDGAHLSHSCRALAI